MIKAEDLSIGNWVSYNNKPIKVTSLLKNWIESNYSPFGYIEYEKLVAIPLSEEILLKCGFVKNIDNNIMSSYDLDKLSIVLPCRLYPKGRVYFNSWAILEQYIKHLHQLQNLTHSLGQELNIEL